MNTGRIPLLLPLLRQWAVGTAHWGQKGSAQAAFKPAETLVLRQKTQILQTDDMKIKEKV